MTTHDELVEEVSSVIRDLWQQTKPMAGSRDTARAILALIAERLRESGDGWNDALLAASPLYPPTSSTTATDEYLPSNSGQPFLRRCE